MVLDPTMMPELPKPACTFADHSYPAFTSKQMHDYAEAAILSYLQHAGEGEPVAFTSPANIAVVVEHDGQPVGVAMWFERRNRDDMPLYAHPQHEPVGVKEAGIVSAYIAELLLALKPFAAAAEAADARNAASEPNGKRVKPWQYVNEPDFAAAYEAYTAELDQEIFSTLTTDTPVAGDGDGWQPIETAPKDGTPVLLFWPNIPAGAKSIGSADKRYTGISVGWYETSEHGVGFMCEGDFAVPSNQDDCTHWRPLPAAPQKGGE